MAKALVKGTERFDAVDMALRTAVEEFNTTLSHFGHSVGFRTFEVVEGTAQSLIITEKGLRQDLAAIREGQTLSNVSSSSADSAFLVPHQRNIHFTGREKLLVSVRNELGKTIPKAWNHRIALYGLGGVGKTQLTFL